MICNLNLVGIVPTAVHAHEPPHGQLPQPEPLFTLSVPLHKGLGFFLSPHLGSPDESTQRIFALLRGSCCFLPRLLRVSNIDILLQREAVGMPTGEVREVRWDVRFDVLVGLAT